MCSFLAFLTSLHMCYKVSASFYLLTIYSKYMSPGEIVYQYDTVLCNMTPTNLGVHILTNFKTHHNDLLVFTQS